jgi:hypothetical protein
MKNECNRVNVNSIEPWRKAIRELNCKYMKDEITMDKYFKERERVFNEMHLSGFKAEDIKG